MLSLYIHIPFCVNKCPYCGFYSTLYRSGIAEDFLDALHLEMVMRAGEFSKRAIGSIYIGGGTPTSLSQGQLTRLFCLINDHVQISQGAEITIEANPNTIDASKLVQLKHLGATRISIGAQSFSNSILTMLGRSHTAGQVIESVYAARSAGFESIGIDLIFGIPGQTEEQWLKTLEDACSLGPKHISAYGLSIDEGSRWYCDGRKGTIGPLDDASAAMYVSAIDTLHARGYHQYEISNFCIPGYECRHNVNYWDRGEYIGLGPASWSFIRNDRWANIDDTDQYISRLKNCCSPKDRNTIESVNRKQAAIERLFLGLRKTAGIDLACYGSLLGPEELDDLYERIRDLERRGLVKHQTGALQLTRQGMLLSNAVLAQMIT